MTLLFIPVCTVCFLIGYLHPLLALAVFIGSLAYSALSDERFPA